MTIIYYYRGLIERGRDYRMTEGYSANSDSGAPLYPWMTKKEYIEAARKEGNRAEFRKKQDLEIRN